MKRLKLIKFIEDRLKELKEVEVNVPNIRTKNDSFEQVLSINMTILHTLDPSNKAAADYFQTRRF